MRKPYLFSSRMVGLPGFEPGSREPKSPSLDQASRQPLLRSLRLLRPINDFALIIKTLVKLQHANRMIKNQYESQKSEKYVSLWSPEEADKFILPMNWERLRKQAFETTCVSAVRITYATRNGRRWNMKSLLLVFRRSEGLRWLSLVASSYVAVFSERALEDSSRTIFQKCYVAFYARFSP